MPRRRVTRVAGHVLGGVSAALVLASWAVSSPAGSAPDELYHLASVWCGQGTDSDHCRPPPGQDRKERLLPHEVGELACFATHPAVAGNCRPATYGDHLEPDDPNPFGNWNDHDNPPIYYATMNTFVTDNLDATVLMIRAANALVAMLLVGGLALLVPTRLRRIPTTAFLVTSVPLALFISTSVNPSAWVVCSVAPLWLAAYAAYETTGTRRRLLWAFMIVATLTAAGARADGALFAILAVGLALGLRLSQLREEWRTTVVAGLAVTFAATLFVLSGHASAVSQGIAGYDPAPVSGPALLIANSLRLPLLWTGSLGFGGLASLGWLDTPMPYLTGFLSLLVWGFVMLSGWAYTWWQKTTAIGLTVIALAAYPLILLQETRVVAGSGVQPRYLLPLLVLLVALSLLPRQGPPPSWGRLQVVALAAALTVAHTVALAAQLVRYVRGDAAYQVGFLDDGWWWQDVPGNAYLPWVVGSVSFAVLSGTVLAQWWPAEDAASPRPEPGPVAQIRTP